MCKVKSGKALKNLQDVQNMVVGIINRQQNKYKSKDIHDAVVYFYKGADIEVSSAELKAMVDDNLSFMYRQGLVDCRGGYFHP